MYGDARFALVAAASTATSAATAHLLFGLYNGLSNLNNDEVVWVKLSTSQNDPAYIWDSTVLSRRGYQLNKAASITNLEFPPMRAGDASQLHFARDATANPSIQWNIWRRSG